MDESMLVQALGLERSRLIALSVAGGKTTLMFALAREFYEAGECVLVTTTTKLAVQETLGPWQLTVAERAEEVLAALPDRTDSESRSGHLVLVYAGHNEDGRKVLGLGVEEVNALRTTGRFDRILVEADGSACKPLKAPADHEPVIPTATDTLVMVAGLNGLGVPLDEATLFRAHRWAALTDTVMGDPVTAKALAKVIVHPHGLGQGCPVGAHRVVFLNQADDAPRSDQAAQVVQSVRALSGECPDRIVAGWLLPTTGVANIWTL